MTRKTSRLRWLADALERAEDAIGDMRLDEICPAEDDDAATRREWGLLIEQLLGLIDIMRDARARIERLTAASEPKPDAPGDAFGA